MRWLQGVSALNMYFNRLVVIITLASPALSNFEILIFIDFVNFANLDRRHLYLQSVLAK